MAGPKGFFQKSIFPLEIIQLFGEIGHFALQTLDNT